MTAPGRRAIIAQSILASLCGPVPGGAGCVAGPSSPVSPDPGGSWPVYLATVPSRPGYSRETPLLNLALVVVPPLFVKPKQYADSGCDDRWCNQTTVRRRTAALSPQTPRPASPIQLPSAALQRNRH